MRIWMAIPALALVAAGALAMSSGGKNTAPVEIAQVQDENKMTDACVWSAEVAAVEKTKQCVDEAATAPRTLVWPDDFIALTADAASSAWDATVSFLTGLYDYAFRSEKEDPAV